MCLNTLKIGQSAKITELKADETLSSRLFSLGIVAGKIVKKINSTLGKNTVAIELEHSCVILRANEAAVIDVQLV